MLMLDVLLAATGGTGKAVPTAPAVLLPAPAGTAALLPTELLTPAFVEEGNKPTPAVLLFTPAGIAGELITPAPRPPPSLSALLLLYAAGGSALGPVLAELAL